MSPWKRKRRVLPGFGLSMGFTMLYLGLVVLIPLSTLFVRTFHLTWGEYWGIILSPRVLASFRLSFGASLAAAAVNALFGPLVAWSLVRYEFPGKGILDALVDLPFALPTAVAGITLTALYAANGWFGRYLVMLGVNAAFTPLGIVIALTFIGLPFVIRTLDPVLRSMEPAFEEAAATLGAGRWQIAARVIFPSVRSALLAGFALSLARALGEYGSVVFISGNMPMKTEIPALLIVTKLEQYDYAGATAIAITMLAASFLLLLSINLLQARAARRELPA